MNKQEMERRLLAKLARNDIRISGRMIIVGNKMPGIKVQGAIDGLVNHCGYTRA